MHKLGTGGQAVRVVREPVAEPEIVDGLGVMRRRVREAQLATGRKRQIICVDEVADDRYRLAALYERTDVDVHADVRHAADDDPFGIGFDNVFLHKLGTGGQAVRVPRRLGGVRSASEHIMFGLVDDDILDVGLVAGVNQLLPHVLFAGALLAVLYESSVFRITRSVAVADEDDFASGRKASQEFGHRCHHRTHPGAEQRPFLAEAHVHVCHEYL